MKLIPQDENRIDTAEGAARWKVFRKDDTDEAVSSTTIDADCSVKSSDEGEERGATTDKGSSNTAKEAGCW